MSGAIPPFPKYAFLAWCSAKKKHRVNFTFTITPRNWLWPTLQSYPEGEEEEEDEEGQNTLNLSQDWVEEHSDGADPPRLITICKWALTCLEFKHRDTRKWQGSHEARSGLSYGCWSRGAVPHAVCRTYCPAGWIVWFISSLTRYA
jgi:hypothetical protein